MVVPRLWHVPRPDVIAAPVLREVLPLTVVERGTLESADNQDVVCRVKNHTQGGTVSTQIKWVIEDGAEVKQGDVVVELDDSALQDQLKVERIALDTALANKIQAEENYKIVVSQNQSDIQSARIAVQLAELDLEKYRDGEYPQSLKDVMGRIKMAESDRDMQQDRAAWATRMVKKGYLTSSQSEAEQSRLQSNDIALEKVREELRVLKEYTRKRTITDLKSKVDEAKRALERVIKQAAAKDVQAYTDKRSKESIYEQELARHLEIKDEIRKCTITAPQDGMVVYYVPDQARYGGGSQQSIIAQGEPVREGQRLMRLPNLRHMVVNTRVHEALISRVHGEELKPTGFGDCLRAALLTPTDVWTRLLAQNGFSEIREKFHDKENKVVFGGQPALVRIDSFPDQTLHGHVKQVATISAQQDWLSADVKVYQTIVAIDESFEGLKPGMSAEVTITVEDDQEPVLTIPLQAIIGSADMGRQRKCFVVDGDGQPQSRDIVIGLSNEKKAEVRSGLKEGEEIVTNPRALLEEKDSGAAASDEKAGTPEAGASKGRSENAGPGSARGTQRSSTASGRTNAP